MATDALTLASQGSLYYGQTPPQWQVMKLALLQQILHAINPMAATDPASLLNFGSAYCSYDPSTRQVMELALLAQIATTSVAPGFGVMTCGNYTGGQPNFTPLLSCAFATDTSNGHVWLFLNAVWHDTGITVGP